jgi:hypothetical protein
LRSPAVSTEVDLEIPRRELFEMVTALVGESASGAPFTLVSGGGLRPGATLRFENAEDPRGSYDVTLSDFVRGQRLEFVVGPPTLGLRLGARFDDRRAGTRLRVGSYFVATTWRRKLLIVLTWPFVWPAAFILRKWFARRIRRAIQEAVIQPQQPTRWSE